MFPKNCVWCRKYSESNGCISEFVYFAQFFTLMMSSHVPWIEKYRPKKISEIRGNDFVVKVLESFGGVGSIPHLIFFGPPGTGKTSTILALAKDFYGTHFDSNVMEINASDERGVDVVKRRIQGFVQTHSFSGIAVKLVILDEADALTSDAQSALRIVLEKSTRYVRFCLCCNYIGQISSALQSRCSKFRFEGIDPVSLKHLANKICLEEHLNISEDSMDAILALSKGDARRVINLLQSIHLQSKESRVTVEDVYKLVGKPLPHEINEVFLTLCESTFKDSHESISKIVQNKGYSIADMLQEISYKSLSRFEHEPLRLCTILIELAEIENNLCIGGSSKLAVGHLVSAFHLVST